MLSLWINSLNKNPATHAVGYKQREPGTSGQVLQQQVFPGEYTQSAPELHRQNTSSNRGRHRNKESVTVCPQQYALSQSSGSSHKS